MTVVFFAALTLFSLVVPTPHLPAQAMQVTNSRDLGAIPVTSSRQFGAIPVMSGQAPK